MASTTLRTSAISAGLACVSLVALIGCSTPLEPFGTDELRQAIARTTAREFRDAGAQPAHRELARPLGEVEATFDDERLRELQDLSGPTSYDADAIELGDDLLGETSNEIGLTLRQVILTGIENNLDLRTAQLSPAISEADVVAAEAVFDAVLFATHTSSWTDQPQVVTSTGGVNVGSRANVAAIRSLETGIRKPLASGGQITFSTLVERTDRGSPGYTYTPNAAYGTNVLVGITQPLLRNFGSDVAYAEIRVNRNIERAAVEELRSRMISVLTEIERTYWILAQARWNLLIRERLLGRGIETRDVLAGRRGFDVTPAEWSDAVARVESRKAEVITAKAFVRQASDALKLLMNHPDLPVGSETIIVPLDRFVDESITYSLLDSITTGVANRPEVQRAILNMDNASVQVMLANNARLPMLDLAASIQYNGLDDDTGSSYDRLADGSYIDYLLRLQFEIPVGNRAAEATYRQTQLQRAQTTLGYQNVVRQVVLDVKTAVRDLDTNYQLIGQRRSARLASAENLRTLAVQEQVQALTPEFLNLKFQRQDQLAAAELQEVNALAEYNIALATLHAAMGVALQRNQIDFVVPEVGK
ncbi:MAG: TolC family protein [Phycisphaerales bacterium]|nr:TolC family protein [Phycisphaerales bacterium]